MMNKTIHTQGIIIRKIDLNEADRIVTILTPDFGKIDCIAKGARHIKSKFSGRLDLFCHIRFTGFSGREIVTLNEVYLLESFPQTEELNHYRILFLIAEITQKLIQPHQHIDGAYPLLVETLFSIQNTNKHTSVLYAYLIRLLTLTGFLPRWNQCALCGTVFDPQLPTFVRCMDAHAVCLNCRHPEDRPLKTAVTQWINTMQNTSLSFSLRVNANSEQHEDVWFWLKEVLLNILPYPLKSVDFLVR